MTAYEQQIQELAGAIDAASDDALREFRGVELMRQGLERRRDQILPLVFGSLNLVLRRTSDGEGGEVRLVAAVLGELQESLRSIGQLLAGKPTQRGVIPGEIARDVELRIASARPGSLDLTLVPAFPEQPREQEPLFDVEGRSLLELSIGRLVEVMQRAPGDRDALLETVAALGSRATGHVITLAKVLSEADAAAVIKWESPRVELSGELTTEVASSMYQLLHEAEESESEISVRGRIVGCSLIHQTFELEDAEGEGVVYSGKADPALLPLLEELFGTEVVGQLEVQELRLRTGETKRVHRLIGVAARSA